MPALYAFISKHAHRGLGYHMQKCGKMCGWSTKCSARAHTLCTSVCQERTIDILDVGASERLESVVAHGGAVWSLAALPDGSGFVSGSADHDVKFWEWEIVTETAQGDAGCVTASHWMPTVS